MKSDGFSMHINPRTYRQSQTPTVAQGGGGVVACILTLGRTGKVRPPPWHKGGGADGHLRFCYATIFREDFTFSRRPVVCSTR